ncbi:phage tail protein [Bradyrhizobium sp. CIAT3101]|uniref:phage tail protein n=1 Tax=Bradyrhizobium sp. CIAT3101 TaxID=439387 RepID=UPI0024B0EB9D|nr:phage tail protein [Bradyrhizobium sp. CIAT3101]WFU83776.1 phage tail protein [Bradyrhizobium sp. CIAT3101]
MTLYKWSQTASADATADSTINWAEGQSPSSVNDSARAMMAAIAKYRDDMAGAIVTSGTSTAYVVSSYQVFQSLSQLGGQIVAFTPHTTNGATVTINVDGLGAKPLRSAPGVELPAGTIVQGTPYVAQYNNADAAFYLQGFYGASSSLIPIGASVDFWGPNAPNSSFALMYGQAISRTTYAALFALFGTTYGVGDGSTTFNIPDCRGRIIAGADGMGGIAANRLTAATMSGTGLGSTSSATETKSLTTGNLPPYTPSGNLGLSSTNTTIINPNTIISIQGAGGGSLLGIAWNSGGSIANLASSMSASFTGTAQGGTSTAFPIVQPTIIANKLLRII